MYNFFFFWSVKYSLIYVNQTNNMTVKHNNIMLPSLNISTPWRNMSNPSRQYPWRLCNKIQNNIKNHWISTDTWCSKNASRDKELHFFFLNCKLCKIKTELWHHVLYYWKYLKLQDWQWWLKWHCITKLCRNTIALTYDSGD